jgi:hypothetical protein
MNHHAESRREWLRRLGLSAACYPFVCNLPSLGSPSSSGRKRRLVIMFTPNGVIPEAFWPAEAGPLTRLENILAPLEPYRDQTLVLQGISNAIKGPGDNHVRGITCLLTGIEMLPGNFRPSGASSQFGWGGGISIDQEIKRFLQGRPQSRTRFGSLEFGVVVRDQAMPYSRMVYAGANKPIPPINDPYQMLQKLYGQVENRPDLQSVLDPLADDFRRIEAVVGSEDRRLIREHAEFVRRIETQLAEAGRVAAEQRPPALDPPVPVTNDHMPALVRMQMELLVNSLAADFTRVATIQFSGSSAAPHSKWLGIPDGHHTLSHEDTPEAVDKLTRIDTWHCEQLAFLVKRLAETPEPDGRGTLLDNTTVIWTNELGHGKSHSLTNIPFVLVGGGLGFTAGRAVHFDDVPHNRLLLAIAHALGHELDHFGSRLHCADGPLTGLV